MLLKDNETRTRRCKTFKCSEMLLEDGEAGRRRNANSLVASTRHHRARLLNYYPRQPCAPSIENASPTTYTYISYFFNKSSLSLYVYTRGILGCLLGFWPLRQNPAGAIIAPSSNQKTTTSLSITMKNYHEQNIMQKSKSLEETNQLTFRR